MGLYTSKKWNAISIIQYNKITRSYERDMILILPHINHKYLILLTNILKFKSLETRNILVVFIPCGLGEILKKLHESVKFNRKQINEYKKGRVMFISGNCDLSLKAGDSPNHDSNEKESKVPRTLSYTIRLTFNNSSVILFCYCNPN